MARIIGDGVYVLVTGPGGDVVQLKPGDKLPDYVDPEKFGDHCFESADGGESAGGDGPPPQSGKGSGKDAWHAYAAASGVEVDDDASREDVIAALEAAGVATE